MSVLAHCGGTAFAQSQMDAHRYAQNELGGTARYLAMGGAFGALGGDISVMNANPAGLAVYRSSEVVTTLSLTSTNAKTDWLGSTSDQTKTKVNFDNIAYVGYFPTGNDEGIVSWNVGFSYNSGETVLRDVSFTAKQGEVTALVGPSGGGKTTVSRLAARFWDNQKGKITIGGMNVADIDPEALIN